MKLSNDLTLVLIRGNGAPRTFNLPLPKLKRNIVLLAGIFLILATTSCVFAALYIHQNYLASTPPVMTEEDRVRLESVNDLSANLADAQAALESRKKLHMGENDKGGTPVTLLGPTSTILANSPVQIDKPTVKRQQGSADVTIEFNLQNTRPDQDRIRGYIVILAKTPKSVYAYPEGAISIDENILVNFAKGETFGISRSRATVATFHDVKAEKGELSFQIFIFSHTGQILASMNVLEERG